MAVKNLNLLINDDKSASVDISDNFLMYFVNVVDEASVSNSPIILHIDIINSTSIQANNINRVLSEDFPILPIENASAENLSQIQKDKINSQEFSVARDLLNCLTNKLALKYAEAKDQGDAKTVNFVENLAVMKDFDLKNYSVKVHKLDSYYKLHLYTNKQIESKRLEAIDTYLKSHKNIFDDKTLHIVCYNGKKYLFGLKSKKEKVNSSEENKIIFDNLAKKGLSEEKLNELKDKVHETTIYYNATEPNASALIDIAKGMINIEHEDKLKQDLANLNALNNMEKF